MSHRAAPTQEEIDGFKSILCSASPRVLCVVQPRVSSGSPLNRAEKRVPGPEAAPGSDVRL